MNSIHANFNWLSLFNENTAKPLEEERANSISLQNTPLRNSLEILKSISSINNVDLLEPPKNDDTNFFFEIRALLNEIEKVLQKKNGFSRQFIVRTRLSIVLAQTGAHQKMIELGLILYYMDHENFLPPADNLMVHTGDQISNTMEVYLDISQGYSGKVSSGKMQYLLNTFAKMVVTSDRTLNRGGVMAIQAMLNSPFKIAAYITAEHRDHILKICHQLLTNKSLPALFKRKIEVHTSLQELIRVDLKLAPNQEITPADVLYDCMQALFTDIRQYDINCYAVSSLIYVSEQYTYKMIFETIHWLSEGVLSCSKWRLPLAPLIEKRLEHPIDLDVKMKPSQALNLISIKHLCKILNLQIPWIEPLEDMSLKKILRTILEENIALEHFGYAKKILCSYKYNSLIHLHLTICEFIHTNMNRKSPDKKICLYTSIKKEFLKETLKTLRDKVKINPIDINLFFSVFKRKLSKNIWFVNCCEKKVKQIDATVKVGSQLVNKFHGNASFLISIFENSIRMFDGRDCKLVGTISGVKNVINYSIKEAAEELKILKVKNIYLHRRIVSNIVVSKYFGRFLSNYCSMQIQKNTIKKSALGKQLNLADLFLLNQEGGDERTMLSQVYQINIKNEAVNRFRTPYQFVKNLMGKLQTCDVELIKNTPRMLITGLIAKGGGHVWTLTPNDWKALIENRNQINKFMRQTIFRHARCRLGSKIPLETMSRIIERLKESGQCIEITDLCTKESEAYTYAQFRDKLLRNNPLSRDEASLIFEEEFSKICLDKRNFTKVLSSIDVVVSSEMFHEIYELMELEPDLPASLARNLRRVLIEKGIRVLDPYEIELAICKVFGLPSPIAAGDLNWGGSYREDPRHLLLMIKFSWMTEHLEFFRRKMTRDFRESQINYKSIGIYFPQ